MKPSLIKLFLLLFLTRTSFSQSNDSANRYDYAESVLQEGISRNDSVKMAEGYYLLAKHYARQANFSKTYELFYTSLKINEQLADFSKMGRIYLRLSELEAEQYNFEKAKEFVNEAISTFEKGKLTKELKNAFVLAGDIQDISPSTDRRSLRLHLDSALFFYQKALKINLPQQNESEVMGLKFKIGSTLLKLSDIRCLALFEEVIRFKKKQEPGIPLLNYSTTLALAYLSFGKVNEAGKILAENEETIRAGYTFSDNFLAHYYDAYTAYYRTIGKWEEAFHMQQKATSHHYKMADIDTKGHTSKWRIILETEKKDLELELRKQKLETQQKIIDLQKLFGSWIALLVLGLAGLSYILHKNLKVQKSLAQKNAVLVQEQSHRVKNNLQVISSMLNLQADYLSDPNTIQVLSESKTRIEAMVLLQRQLYENNNNEFIDLNDLFHDIISSIGITFGHPSINFSLRTPVEFLHVDTAICIGLIFNELIINSFKYVFNSEVPEIEVILEKGRKGIDIIYKDFGKTDLTDTLNHPDRKGFGMNLIDMILSQINGKINYTFNKESVFTISFKEI